MTLPLVVRATVTVVFAATAVLHLFRCLGVSRWRAHTGGVAWVNDLVHLLMSVEMVAMAWHGPVSDRWNLQLTVLAVATGWFLVQAVAPWPVGLAMTGVADVPDRQRRAVPKRPSCRTLPARGACIQHAIVAAVMIWMIAVMPAGGAQTAVDPGGPMRGMAMSAASATDNGMGGYLGWLLGGYLVLSASWWLLAAHRGRPHVRRSAPRIGRQRAAGLVAGEPAAGAISYAVMAAGMAAVLLTGH